MRSILLGLTIGLLLIPTAALRAQSEGPIDTEPHLSLAFPFEQQGAGIGVKHAVLINDIAVIPPNAVLRVIYVPPRGDDVEVKIEAAKGNSENAWTKNNKLDDHQPRYSPLQRAAKKIAEDTVWTSVTVFQLAFANLNSQDIHLVYMNPENKKLTDEPINFPEGLVLGDVDDKVTVLAVQKESPGATAGLKAGDIILKVGGNPMNGNLLTFRDAYHAAKKAARDAGASTFDLAILGSADKTERIARIKLPISLNTSLLDSPISDPGTLNKPPIPKTKPFGEK